MSRELVGGGGWEVWEPNTGRYRVFFSDPVMKQYGSLANELVWYGRALEGVQCCPDTLLFGTL